MIRRLLIANLVLTISLVSTVCAETRGNALSKCTEGKTTNDVEVCVAGIAEKATENLKRYIAVARERIGDDKQALKAFEAVQTAFEAYEKSMCDAVYQYWREGTIRGTKSQCCSLRLLNDRTVSVWEEYLQYEDSTPPPLPRPEGELCG